MKKSLKILGVIAFVVVMAVAAMAQEPTEPGEGGITIDPTILSALIAFVGGGLVTALTQIIKAWTKVTGFLARVVTGLIAVLATGFYFVVINPPFDWKMFAIYAVVIFIEATGIYHFVPKSSTPTS